MAELGVAVRLFVVGLELGLELLRRLGRVALMPGLGRLVFIAAPRLVIACALGLDALTALYVAGALTFSSTIIIVTLLSAKKAIASRHGQIALGFCIGRDVVVVLAMIRLSAMGVGCDGTGAGRWRAGVARRPTRAPRGRPLGPPSGRGGDRRRSSPARRSGLRSCEPAPSTIGPCRSMLNPWWNRE